MFNISKRLNKLLACFLTALLLMSNTVALVPVYAAASANTSEQSSELPEITLDKQGEDKYQNKQNEDTANLSTKQKVVQFINQLIPYYAQGGKQQGPEWLRTTDINLTFTEDLKPIYSLETIQPFTKEVTDGKLSFWQGRYAYQSGANSTANLGVGLRWLSEDKTSITGVNAFYDYAFKHDLSRVGVGAEYFNKQAEYRANVYIPTSGDRQTGTTALADGMMYSYIRAVSGFDYEVGTTLANAPWLSLYASGFHYDNKHKADENGYRLRSKMQLTPRLSMEMGYTNSNLTSGSLYGKVLYQLADTAGPALRGGSAKELSNDISHKLLQKVQRENDIKTETFTRLVAYTGNLSVTVTNSSGAALQGAQVQAYQNGSPVGAAAVTDATGTVLLSGLAAGEYTVRAAYFSVSDDSPVVTVQKDQTANTAIALAVLGGKASINVLDNAGAGVGGATVTAETSGGGLHGAADKSLFDRILGVKTAYAAAAFTVTAVTDANGIATFTNLPPGNYKFTVTLSGKEMKSLAVEVADGSTSNATVVLPASGGNIVAMISDAVSKAVINGAAVELKSGSTVIDTKTTDSDGTAVFSGLTAGSTYTIAASAVNYSGKSINTTVTDKETVAAAIVLTPLQQTGSATITVTDGTNSVSGATVSVMINGQERTATTGSNGEVVFASLPAGTYTFTAAQADYNSNSAATTITGGAATAASIALTRQTGNATITVTDGASPVSDASVSVTVNGQAQTATTAANGEATFTNIPTGTYTFTATKTDYGSATASDVVIANGATATANITLTRQTGGAKITVTDGTAPLKDATVSVTINGQTQTATTDTNGVATFTSIPAGTYSFTATLAGYGSGTANDVAISNGAEAAAAITLTRQTSGAKIMVKDAANAPIKGVTVSVTVNGKEETAKTDTNGVATFTSIPTGTYSFTATMAGYVSGAANDVVIGNGAEATAAITLTRKIVNVTIAVIDYEDNQPIGEAKVTVTLNGETISTTNTTSDGKAIFENLTTGYYNFIVTKVGYSKSSLGTTINDTTTETIELIRPKNQITITVKGTDGKPIEGVDVTTMVEIGDEIKPVTKTTNASGIAKFTELPTAKYTFTATKAGYDSQTTAVTVYGGEPNGAGTITLSPKLITAEVNVKDDAWNNMAWYTSVRVTGNGVDQTKTTDGSGKVDFSLPAGEYIFTATYQYDGFYNNASETIVLSDTTSSVALKMVRKVGSITLIVKDKNSQQPISGAEITKSYTDDVLGYTDGEGKLTLNDVPTGSYYYTARKAGYQGMINGVDVNEGTNEKVIELPSLPTGKLTITVKDSDIGVSGQLEGATVTVQGNGVSQTASTDASGMAVFLNLPIGGYTVSVSRANYTNASTDLTVNEGNNSKTISITASFLDIGLYVTESGTMSMLGGVKVTITHESGYSATQMTTAGVNMIISNVPRGTYTFVLEKAGYTTITQDREITRKDGANAPVFVMFKN